MSIFILIWAIWFISEIAINRVFRSPGHDHNDQDKGSLQLIWVIVYVAIAIGIFCAVSIDTPLSHGLVLPGVGLLLILLGMGLRFFSIYALGGFFTVEVAIQTHHTIKTDGIYRRIRHPSYAGSLLSFTGFGISLNNWVSVLVIVCLVFLAMRYRMAIEERVLLEQFGREYADYMERTARLIPGIY